MKKILTKFLPLLLLISLISCNQLVVGIEKTFSYWANGATIIGIELPPNLKVDGDGFSSLSSGQDARICFKLNNPQKFEFLMPGYLNAPADIIVFDGKVKGKNGGRPEFGEDYSLIQKSSDTLELTYTKEFLLKNEQGKANLNPKIKLYNKKDNRRFAQNYNYKLRANTVPPKPKWVTAGKIQQGTDWYYVLIFEFEGLTNSTDIENFLHKDISEVLLTEVGTQETTIQIKLTNNGFDDSPSNAKLIPSNISINDLAASDVTGDLTDFPHISDITSDARKWMLCIKTGVKVGQSLSYKVKVKDLRGLPSEETLGVTNAAKLPIPEISYHSDMDELTDYGVYKDNENALSTGTSTNPILISSCFGNTVVLKAYNGYYPSGVTIEATVKLSASTPAPPDFTGHKGRIQKIGNTTKILLDPIPGMDEIYEVKLKARGPNYTDSDEKTYYYQIKKEVRAGDSSWQILKKAVNLASFGDTIYIKGHIISTSTANNSGEIEVREDINIQGLNGKAGDIIDANKDGASKPGTPHRIFTIKSGKSLNLTGLTLQNGKAGIGGAVISENGSVLTLSNTDIKNSEASIGGGAISTGGTFKISGSAKIVPSAAPDENALGKNDVYLTIGKIITVTGALTETSVARITPADNTYTEGREVVKGDGYILNDADISKFSLTQKLGQTWSLQRDSTLNALVLKKEITEITTWKGLQDAVNAASPGDTITVKNTLTADDTTSEISITKNLTIKGRDTSAVLDANYKHRIFKVLKGSDEVTLTLKDITLKKGKSITGLGAGVHVTGASLELENVTITECKNNANSGKGGAIYISNSSNGRLWIKGSSKILSNGAEKGAAIYIDTNSDANIIEGSAEIRGNICQSNGQGGGIYLYKGKLVLKDNAKILNNESRVGAAGGGGVYISEHGTLTIKDSCIIQENEAKNSDGSVITGNGGGIYNSGKLIMEGGEIKENEAKFGGAVYNGGTFKISGSAKIELSEGSDENTLGKNDIYLPADKVITVTGTLTQTSVARISPITPYSAGRQVVEAASGVILAGQVSKFKVTNDTDEKKWKVNAAGKLELANKTITVTSWKELKKAVKGGEYNTILVNSNLTAAYGTDEENYGTIEIEKNMTIKGNNTSSQNVIEINLATFKGGGLNKKHKIFKIKGGAVVKLENLELKNGYSKDSGGGIQIVESGNVTLSKVTIDNCTAKANGGGIAVLKGSLKIENSSLIQNCKALKDTGVSTTANGGGIFVGSSGNLELDGVRIYKNSADKNDGGGIYTKGTTRIISATIEENSSISSAGGGLYIEDGTCTIGNTATGNIIIKNNKSDLGAGIYIHKGTLDIQRGLIEKNSTEEGTGVKYGGGLYLANGTVNMSGGEIKTNSADLGGALYFENGTFKMSDSAKITPSTGGDEHTHGKNDVYLSDNKTIKITGTLTAGQNQAARITVHNNEYIEGRIVLEVAGTVNLSNEAKKFKVTKKGGQSWYVGNNGQLTTTAP